MAVLTQARLKQIIKEEVKIALKKRNKLNETVNIKGKILNIVGTANSVSSIIS